MGHDRGHEQKMDCKYIQGILVYCPQVVQKMDYNYIQGILVYCPPVWYQGLVEHFFVAKASESVKVGQS